MPNDCIQKMVKIFTDSEPFQKVILIKYHSACKDKHFSRHESTVCRLFRFSSKTGGNRPSAYCIRYRFSALGPELSPRRVAIWVVFFKNSTTPHTKTASGSPLPRFECGKRAKLLLPQPPPPYAPEAIAPLLKAEYVKFFPCVAWCSVPRAAPSMRIRGHGATCDMI